MLTKLVGFCAGEARRRGRFPAWADEVARRSGVEPLGIAPKRRTMVQLAVGRLGLRQMPLVGERAVALAGQEAHCRCDKVIAESLLC